MITIDIERPKSCQDCFLSCIVPSVPATGTKDIPYTGKPYNILCRVDMNIHNGPDDESCPIQNE